MTEPRPPSSTIRTIVSLLLFIHLFCVFAALTGNFRRAPLVDRLILTLSPYLKTLNFDPDFTRFHFVQSAPIDDDRYLEVELLDAATGQPLAGAPRVELPQGTWRAGLSHRRHLAVAYLLGMFAMPENENDSVTSLLARSVGARVMHEYNAKRVVVRCNYRMSQPLYMSNLMPGFPPDPRDPRYDVKLYEADVWIDDDGQVQVNKRTAAAESAPVQLKSSSENPTPQRLTPSQLLRQPR